MVKHIILWTLKEEISAEEKEKIKVGIKEGLEGLAGQIPGLMEIHVQTECLPSSNAEVMLDTTFESAEALKGYSTHPAHVAVVDGKVRPYTATRTCMDFEAQEKVLQKIMGHSTLQMTMDLYCHIREDKIKDEMTKIAE